MKIKNIGSVLAISIASGVISLSFVSAMEMMDNGATSTLKKDTMMKDDMKKSTRVASDMMMFEKTTSASSRVEITKLQKTLVTQGYLVMPKGAAYGFYGKGTKTAHTKYNKASMTMKNDSMIKKDTVMKKGDSAMMKDDAMMKKDIMIAEAGSYESFDTSKIAMASATHDIVLFFKASWCPSCRAVDADIKANSKNIPSNLTILEVDYDKSAFLKQKYGVTYQHTFVKVDAQGNLIKKWSGSPTLSALVSQVK